MDALTRTKIGECWVDSGQLMIVDPCYMEKWGGDEFVPSGAELDGEPANRKFSYEGCCNVTLGEGRAGQLDHGAVVSSTGYGDGSYPVYAYYNDEGRIMRLEVDFGESESVFATLTGRDTAEDDDQ